MAMDRAERGRARYRCSREIRPFTAAALAPRGQIAAHTGGVRRGKVNPSHICLSRCGLSAVGGRKCWIVQCSYGETLAGGLESGRSRLSCFIQLGGHFSTSPFTATCQGTEQRAEVRMVRVLGPLPCEVFKAAPRDGTLVRKINDTDAQTAVCRSLCSFLPSFLPCFLPSLNNLLRRIFRRTEEGRPFLLFPSRSGNKYRKVSNKRRESATIGIGSAIKVMSAPSSSGAAGACALRY